MNHEIWILSARRTDIGGFGGQGIATLLERA